MPDIERKLDPSEFIEAPRRSGAIPNSTGTHALFSLSTYSFTSHSSKSGIHVLDLVTEKSSLFSNDSQSKDHIWTGHNSDLIWRKKAEGNEETQFWIGSASSPNRKSYQAGVIGFPAVILKASRLSGGSFGLLVLGPTKPTWNDSASQRTYSTGREYSSLPVLDFDKYTTSISQTLWYLSFEKCSNDEVFKLSDQPINVLENSELVFDPYSGVIPMGPTNCDLSSLGIVFVAKKRGPYQYRIWTSNLYHVFLADLNSHKSPTNITTPKFSGKFALPVFSAKGTSIAFLRTEDEKKITSKSHIFVIRSISNGTAEEILTVDGNNDCWPLNPEKLLWSSDGQSLYISAAEAGRQKLFEISAMASMPTSPSVLVTTGSVSSVYRYSEKPTDKRLLVSRTSFTETSVFMIVDPAMNTKVISSLPFCKDAGLASSQVSEIWYKGAGNYLVHAWVIKPSYYEEGKKYPFLLFIHGGPLSSWLDSWGTRWNPVVFAEQGYIAVLPDFTGSPGYNENFREAAILDYGGRPYQDLEKCFEYVAKHIPFADTTRSIALGGSYGGYMVFWLAGKSFGKKFKALVAHDGIFNPSTLYACDVPDKYRVLFGGYNSNPIALNEIFDKWDPSKHVKNWTTPMLIIHSDKDTRHPVSMGLAAFTALQFKGVESRYLNFPDEGHFVAKPENSLHWHRSVIGWINKFAGIDGIELGMSINEMQLE